MIRWVDPEVLKVTVDARPPAASPSPYAIAVAVAVEHDHLRIHAAPVRVRLDLVLLTISHELGVSERPSVALGHEVHVCAEAVPAAV